MAASFVRTGKIEASHQGIQLQSEQLDPAELVRLGSEIHLALLRPLAEHPYDWAAAKQRVREAIKTVMGGNPPS